MSQENAEALRAAIDAYNARSVEGLMAVFDPEIEFMPLLTGLTNTPYRGESGVRDWLAAIEEDFEFFVNRCDRVEDHGEYALAVGHGEGRGRVSGAEIHQPWVQLARFRDGRVVWWQTFRTRGEALEAVGLRE